MKLTLTVAGSEELQEPPPPVQAEAGSATTVVETVVDAVMVPEHGVPRPALLHVYVSAPAAAEGLPLAAVAKSDVTWAQSCGTVG